MADQVSALSPENVILSSDESQLSDNYDGRTNLDDYEASEGLTLSPVRKSVVRSNVQKSSVFETY